MYPVPKLLQEQNKRGQTPDKLVRGQTPDANPGQVLSKR